MRARDMSSPTDNRTTIHLAATKLFQLPLAYSKNLDALPSLRQRDRGDRSISNLEGPRDERKPSCTGPERPKI